MDQNFMKEKKILPLVISMSLPMVISMAVNSLYNIVDSYFVAKISENAMTALSLVYPVQNLMTAIAVGFGVGMNARVAFCLGAGDKKQADQAAVTGLLLGILHGAALMVVCMLGMPKFLSLFTDNEEIIRMGLVYAKRAFLFSVIIMLGISMEKIFQAVGIMKVSMISMMCGFIVNIVLDPLMIFGIGPFPQMGMAGAAYATGIGQTITLLVYILFHMFRPLPVSFGTKNISFNRELMQKLYAVGIPASLNMALPSLLISSLNGILSMFSETYLSFGEWNYPGDPSSGQLQLWSRREEACGTDFLDSFVSYSWCYGGWDAAFLPDSRTDDRFICLESGNDKDWRDDTSYHQSWIYRVGGFGYLLRNTGRTWNGNGFFNDFFIEICGGHYSGRVSFKQGMGSGRSVLCIPGDRACNSSVCFCNFS